MKEPKLEDLTKEELLALIRRNFFHYTQRDINGVRWEAMAEKARAKMADALKDIDRLKGGIEDRRKRLEWFDAQQRFDAASKLYDQASRFFDEILMGEKKGRAATRPSQTRQENT